MNRGKKLLLTCDGEIEYSVRSNLIEKKMVLEIKNCSSMPFEKGIFSGDAN